MEMTTFDIKVNSRRLAACLKLSLQLFKDERRSLQPEYPCVGLCARREDGEGVLDVVYRNSTMTLADTLRLDAAPAAEGHVFLPLEALYRLLCHLPEQGVRISLPGGEEGGAVQARVSFGGGTQLLPVRAGDFIPPLDAEAAAPYGVDVEGLARGLAAAVYLTRHRGFQPSQAYVSLYVRREGVDLRVATQALAFRQVLRASHEMQGLDYRAQLSLPTVRMMKAMLLPSGGEAPEVAYVGFDEVNQEVHFAVGSRLLSARYWPPVEGGVLDRLANGGVASLVLSRAALTGAMRRLSVVDDEVALVFHDGRRGLLSLSAERGGQGAGEYLSGADPEGDTVEACVDPSVMLRALGAMPGATDFTLSCGTEGQPLLLRVLVDEELEGYESIELGVATL